MASSDILPIFMIRDGVHLFRPGSMIWVKWVMKWMFVLSRTFIVAEL
jgi:hypothetical protein